MRCDSEKTENVPNYYNTAEKANHSNNYGHVKRSCHSHDYTSAMKAATPPFNLLLVYP
ncbi:hypothetical protein LXJ15735_36630 [Lacrimispora xylanolytica]